MTQGVKDHTALAGEGPCPWGVRAVFNPTPWGSSSAALRAPTWEKLVSVLAWPLTCGHVSALKGRVSTSYRVTREKAQHREPAVLACVLWLWVYESSSSLRACGSSSLPGHIVDDKKAATQGGSRQETKA